MCIARHIYVVSPECRCIEYIVWRLAPESARAHNLLMADYLSPGAVQERLEVKGAGLRRLATLYERVHGPLPRDQRQGRLYPEEAVQRLEHARDDVQAGRYSNIESALRGVVAVEGVEVQAERYEATRRNLEALTEEIRLLRGAVEAQTRRLEALEQENRALRAPQRPQDESQEPPQFSEGVELGEDTVAPESSTQEPDYTTAGATHRLARWLRGWWR